MPILKNGGTLLEALVSTNRDEHDGYSKIRLGSDGKKGKIPYDGRTRGIT